MFKIEADLILRNGMYLDVYERKFVKSDIAIKDGKIIAIGENLDVSAKQEKDIAGKFVTPGFIDGHIHLESSIISPEDFAKIASIHGTTALINDPHEITNVCGIDGIKYMLQKTKNLPISVYFMIPSCVPASPFSESAYTLDSKDVAKCFDLDDKERILGSAEMMNYPGVINEDPEVIAKIEEAKKRGKRVDGHAPGLTGKDLEKYIKAGIESDHECSTIESAMERIDTARRLGQEFYIMIRQGSAAKNIEELAGLINMPEYKDNVMFCTDDKHPHELRSEGHIDNSIRMAIALGISPEDAYVTATYGAAKYFGLDKMGRIEEGVFADIVVIDDLENVRINSVYKFGELMTTKKLKEWPKNKVDENLEYKVRNTINMREITPKDIDCKGIAREIIGAIPNQIITTDAGAEIDYNLEEDIIKIVNIEAHKGTNQTGIGYIKGTGLKKGAFAITVNHDSHNIIATGTNDEDIVKAVNKLIKCNGGMAYVVDGEIKALLELPIANIMTDEDPLKVEKKLKVIEEIIKTNKGINLPALLSFMGLEVIGDVKILTQGPFNTKKFRYFTQEEQNENYLKTFGKDRIGIEPFDN